MERHLRDYIHSLPFIDSLKPLKIWMDGMGPFPGTFHPGLRLEDKWNQYQLLKAIAPMPETMIFDPEDTAGVDHFIERKKKAVLKRRVGRGGRDLQDHHRAFIPLEIESCIEPLSSSRICRKQNQWIEPIGSLGCLRRRVYVHVCQSFYQAHFQSRDIDLYLSRKSVRTE